MIAAQRLFDCLDTNLQNRPDEVLLSDKIAGKWVTYTSRQVNEIVNQFAAGLISKGIGPNDGTVEGRDKVAVISKNRSEWIMLDLAVQKIGAILVPVYPTININELQFVFADAKVKMVFVNDETLYHKVYSIKNELPELKDIYTFEHVPKAAYWEDIMQDVLPEHAQMVNDRSEKITGNDVATIIYTSGTTGTPKGVLMLHSNILSNVVSSMPIFPPGDDFKALSFLPLNHIFEKMVTYIYLFKGTAIYYAESLDTIGENLKEIKPHLFTTVPRLLEKVYDKIMAKGNELTGFKKRLFIWAHNLAEKFEINKLLPLGYRIKLAIANKLIFKKWREALGGNVLCIVTGGAACQVRLIRIFTAAKITIMEGYGLTETSPVIAVNRYEESGRKFGTVGPLIDGVEVKIAEDGEILCKGPNITPGYYRRPDLTEEAIKDGWFATGDIGVLDNNNFLKITDRKKEMFKTSGGKYVAPLPIENKFKESPFIEQIMVVGADKKFVGALIVPSFENIKVWAGLHNLSYTTNESLLQFPEIQQLYKNLVEKMNQHFNQVEQIKKFELIPAEWSIDSGELTPKLSMKRKVISEKYKEAIARIYEG